MEERLIAQMRRDEERHWWFAGRRRVLLALVQAELPEGSCLLDVGCGTGAFLEAAVPRYPVAGLDPSPQAVGFCHARGLHEVRQGGVEALADYPTRHDAVTFFDVLEHLDDDVGALRLARSVLRPGGMVFASVPAYQWLWSHHDDAHCHRRRYTAGRLERHFEDAGFRDIRTGYFNSRLFPVALPVRLFQRLTGRGREADLRPPAEPVNQLFLRLFSGEARRLSRQGSRGYPFGLSVFGVGTA